MKRLHVTINVPGQKSDSGVWCDTVYDSDIKEITAIIALPDGSVIDVSIAHIKADLTE